MLAVSAGASVASSGFASTSGIDSCWRSRSTFSSNAFTTWFSEPTSWWSPQSDSALVITLEKSSPSFACSRARARAACPAS